MYCQWREISQYFLRESITAWFLYLKLKKVDVFLMISKPRGYLRSQYPSQEVMVPMMVLIGMGINFPIQAFIPLQTATYLKHIYALFECSMISNVTTTSYSHAAKILAYMVIKAHLMLMCLRVTLLLGASAIPWPYHWRTLHSLAFMEKNAFKIGFSIWILKKVLFFSIISSRRNPSFKQKNSLIIGVLYWFSY